MKQDFKAIQVAVSLDPGLLEEFPDFRDAVKASVYSCGRAFKSVAADLDMSVSELSRKLNDNPNDPVHFPLHRLPDLLQATGDLRPIYWLVKKFIEDPEIRRDRAIDELARLLPQIHAALKSAKE